MITSARTGTNVHEIADGICCISTPIDVPDGQGFSFNQSLLVGDAPLLFHTSPRGDRARDADRAPALRRPVARRVRRMRFDVPAAGGGAAGRAAGRPGRRGLTRLEAVDVPAPLRAKRLRVRQFSRRTIRRSTRPGERH